MWDSLGRPSDQGVQVGARVVLLQPLEEPLSHLSGEPEDLGQNLLASPSRQRDVRYPPSPTLAWVDPTQMPSWKTTSVSEMESVRYRPVL